MNGNLINDIEINKKFVELSQNIENRVSAAVKEEVNEWKNRLIEHKDHDDVKNDTKQVKRNHSFPNTHDKDGKKVFIPRPSLLTELLKTNHLRSIHYACGAALAVLVMHQIFHEIIHKHSFDFGLKYLFLTFDKLDKILYISFLMHMSTIFIVYGIFSVWAYNRDKNKRVFDICGLSASILYFLLFMQYPVKLIIEYEFTPVASFIILMEQIRLLMKSWAFVRTNTGRVLKNAAEPANHKSSENTKPVLVNGAEAKKIEEKEYMEESNSNGYVVKEKSSNECVLKHRLNKNKDDETEIRSSKNTESNEEIHDEKTMDNKLQNENISKKKEKIGTLHQYLYFLFAPTLLYRDEYPRNPTRDWNKVIYEFLQVISCTFFINLLFTRFIIENFRSYKNEPYSFSKLWLLTFETCFASIVVYVTAFFLILHAWQNTFAEILRFADRKFYQDWWNSTAYSRFYRTWNIIVHDWLYEYVYKELIQLQKKHDSPLIKSKNLPLLSVFLTSAVVHEYIIAFSLRFYFPVLLILFGGIGMFLTFFRTKSKYFNIFIWFSLIHGNGIMIVFYMAEWYARMYCPPVLHNFGDYFVPRSLFCTETMVI